MPRPLPIKTEWQQAIMIADADTAPSSEDDWFFTEWWLALDEPCYNS
jgi:hypothetical protein